MRSWFLFPWCHTHTGNTRYLQLFTTYLGKSLFSPSKMPLTNKMSSRWDVMWIFRCVKCASLVSQIIKLPRSSYEMVNIVDSHITEPLIKLFSQGGGCSRLVTSIISWSFLLFALIKAIHTQVKNDRWNVTCLFPVIHWRQHFSTICLGVRTVFLAPAVLYLTLCWLSLSCVFIL